MKRYFVYAVLPALAVAVLGTGAVSAQGWFGRGADFDPQTIAERQIQMFESQADLLDTSPEQVKEYWAEGKSMREMAEDLGLSEDELHEKMRQARQKRMEEELQALVDNGVVTQEQVNRRLEVMKNKLENGKTGGGFYRGPGHRGFGYPAGDN